MKDAGVAVDIWIDKGSEILRYIEVALDGELQPRLVPIFYANVPRDASYLKIGCVTAAQLALAPVLRHPATVTAHNQLRSHIADFVNAYNFARRLKTLKGLTPYEVLCKAWTKNLNTLGSPT